MTFQEEKNHNSPKFPGARNQDSGFKTRFLILLSPLLLYVRGKSEKNINLIQYRSAFCNGVCIYIVFEQQLDLQDPDLSCSFKIVLWGKKNLIGMCGCVKGM